MTSPELKGAEVDFSFKDGKAIVTVEHVGKIGSVKLVAELEAKPLLAQAIDEVEKLIPGDQKFLAEGLKAALAKVEI